MRTIITLFFTFFSVALSAQEIQWMSLAEALEAQKNKPKKIFMDAYTKWCGPCKKLDKFTFGNPDVAQYIATHFYAVKFNAEGNEAIDFYDETFENPNYNPSAKGRNVTHQFTQFLGISGYPTMVFFSEKGDPIMPLMGYYKPQELEPYLKFIVEEKYKTFSSQEDMKDYLENFTPVFRE